MVNLLHLLDILFFVFHVALIFFNLFGWIFRPLRKWNLLTLGLTAFSWFVLGYFFGFGYCFLTDWHWQVREHLGYATPYRSYIQFLLNKLLGVSFPTRTVDMWTAILFFAAMLASITANIRTWKRKLSSR
jgi:hypothetical protein